MKQVLDVEIKHYKITITDEDFSKTMEDLKLCCGSKKRLFVISNKVFKLYFDKLGISKDEVLVLPDGEKNKNFKNYTKILETAAQKGLTRNDIMIAVGGGVIGDITGFAASTYMRGIDYIQIPTTLLSMVDSSVGGKTAVDMCGIKNIVGTFWQPKAVFININFLKTLDKKQFMSGLGEVLKYSLIEDSCGYSQSLYLFEYLMLCCDKLYELEPVTVMRVIEYCLNLKIAVITQDEKEAGLRKILNLGHTIGHALEAMGKYKKYTHGEAVAQGIFFMLNWAYKNQIISYSYHRMAIELLTRYGFKEKTINVSELINFIKKDKKADSEKITFIIPCDKKKVKEVKFRPEEILEMF